jgi:hypothetical protein
MTDHATPDRQQWIATEQPTKERRNMAKDKTIEELITELEDASFACGDYNEEGDKPYAYYFEKAEQAKKNLVAAIKKLEKSS